jgi:hypothetical protein
LYFHTGKTIKFTHLFPQLNKKYNYNDIADLSTSTLNITSLEKQNPQETTSEKVDANNNIDNLNTVNHNQVKDWLMTKEYDVEQINNNNNNNNKIDQDHLQFDNNTASLLDTTQQIDNRHTLLLHNRSTRTSQYDRMSNTTNLAAKIRSHSADSRNKREDEEDNESFMSCVEEILSRSRSRSRSRSSSSSIHSGQCFNEIDTNKKKGANDLVYSKGVGCTFDYGCLASTMTTIQPSNNDLNEVV